MSATSLLTPEQQRKNRNLGLLLGGVSIALTALFFIIFVHRGLPKDPDEWKREQALHQAQAATSVAEPAPR